MFIPARRQNTARRFPRPAPSSAITALLAATAIPQRRSRKSAPHAGFYAVRPPPPFNATILVEAEAEVADEAAEQADEELDDIEVDVDSGDNDGDEDDVSLDPGPRTPLQLLLRPLSPDDSDDSTTATADDSYMMERSGSNDGRLSFRSSSSESVPSLDTDNESSCSFGSSWSQPTAATATTVSASASASRRPLADARSRIVTSPPEECDFNHPLMPAPALATPAPGGGDGGADEAESAGLGLPLADELSKLVSRRLNLVSNLSASFRVLKSAAKSFTNLTYTTAIQQPHANLATNMLYITTSPYTDERRPRPLEEDPTPALRRYLNPWSSSHDESPCTGAVQMQTYNLVDRKRYRLAAARAGRSPEPAILEEVEEEDDEGASATEPALRQREVRENSGFLRIAVLEMNMRRCGKINDQAPGRARYTLPPRLPYKRRPLGHASYWEPIV